MSVSATTPASDTAIPELTPAQKKRSPPSYTLELSGLIHRVLRLSALRISIALVFPTVFFNNLDPLAATIASYGTFAAGYLARPWRCDLRPLRR